MNVDSNQDHTFTVFHLCSGIGLGSLGFQLGHARIGRASAKFRTLGGVDNDAVACADFRRIVGAPCAEIDLFDTEQYIAFHGRTPPSSWREATADDIRDAAQGEFPDVLFWSPPCKGLSGLLNGDLAGTEKYAALNRLVIRALDLALDAFADHPPALVLLENVPRIQTRGRNLLDAVKVRLELAGYTCAETVHDCGELGGLAQHRSRFLLVARHRQRIRPFLYEPDRRPVRGVGEVIGALPMPDDAAGGPMHNLPNLQWKTWVRLALIEAGSDWRSLNQLDVVDGVVRGLRLIPGDAGWHQGIMGVNRWEDPACTITGRAGVTTGAFSVADPRPDRPLGDYQPYGVIPWDESAGAITGKAAAGTGCYSVADPRYPRGMGDHDGKMRVEAWDKPAHTVIGSDRVGSGAMSIADPRPGAGWNGKGKYQTTGWEDPAPAVLGASTTGQGAFTLADPRIATTKFNDCFRVVRWDEAAYAITSGGTPSAGGQSIADPRVGSKREGGAFESSKHYGVVQWNEPTDAITGHACHDNGAFSVADPRRADERCAPWIVSLDNTRHRPFTTLELLALQGYPLESILTARLGGSDSLIREHIGNGVPVASATGMANTFLATLLAAKLGSGFVLSNTPIWVDRQTALALVAP